MLNFDLIIQPATDGYAWGLYPQGQPSPRLQGTFRLDTVELKGSLVKLSRLDDAFTYFDKDFLRTSFDEAAQLQLGQYLYQSLFADAPADFFPAQKTVLLRVVSDDAFIQRLPWNVLTRHNTFLVMENWHITVATQTSGAARTVQFADAPKVLLVCQEPSDQTATKAREHGNELLQYFRGRYGYFLNPQALAVVSDWAGFVRKLTEQTWDVIYYYGHGMGDGYGASLLFADGAGKAMEVSMGKLADVLKNAPPSLLYLNACRSGGNGIAGSVTHLGMIPALLVNRTDALTDAALEQGRIFLERLLVDHYPPHQAITHAYSSKGHGLASVRWMTPILYQHYTEWHFPNSNVQHFVGKDMHWYLKLDRTAQFSRVFYHTNDMLVSDSPTTLVCFWHGTQQQGVDRFHARLPIELKQRSRDMEMVTFSFRWPLEFLDPHKVCERMVREGFGVSFLDALPGMLQNLSIGGISNPLVVHCRFETLRKGSPMNLGRLAVFLKWWETEVHARLRSYGIRTLLALGYELKEPDPQFATICRNELTKVKLKSGMKLELLDELQQVSEQDILDFLAKFDVELPVVGDDRTKLINDIVVRTDGHYEKVLNELQTIVSQAHKLFEQQMLPANVITDHGY